MEKRDALAKAHNAAKLYFRQSRDGVVQVDMKSWAAAIGRRSRCAGVFALAARLLGVHGNGFLWR